MKNKSKNKSCYDWIKYWFELAGIVVGIAGVFMLVFQYHEMVNATKATLQSVEVSKGQMDVMKRQLDDSEAQQRALLEFGQFTVKRITNSGENTDTFTIGVSYTIKNMGNTPAIDLAGFGESFPDGEYAKKLNLGFTNTLKKWDHSRPPTPSPFNGMGLIGIMPQETRTNPSVRIMEQREFIDNYYFEQWISYRDIFWHSWIIGEGGHYNITNDSFVPEFIYSGQYLRN